MLLVVLTESSFDFMLLDMGDPSRDRIADVLRRDSSSLAFSLEEPEPALVDSGCADLAAILLNPSLVTLSPVVAVKVPCILTAVPRLLASNSMLSTLSRTGV